MKKPKNNIIDGLVDLYNDNKLSEKDECAILNALEYMDFDITTL